MAERRHETWLVLSDLPVGLNMLAHGAPGAACKKPMFSPLCSASIRAHGAGWDTAPLLPHNWEHHHHG
jgi:hypothetical protein